MSFEFSLAFTLRWEAGKVDDEDDPGGGTAYGITQTGYDTWYGYDGTDQRRDIFDIGPEDVVSFYHKYWMNSGGQGFDALDPRLGLLMFDASVNHSPHEAVRLLQTALQGLKVDGQYGETTHDRLMEVWDATPDLLLRDVVDARKDFYVTLALTPKLTKFLGGWLARVSDCRNVANARPEDLLGVVTAAHGHAKLLLPFPGIP